MESFAELVAEIAAPPCVICTHPERDDIERARADGMPYTEIARVLKTIETFGPNVSIRSAAERVGVHFKEHV